MSTEVTHIGFADESHWNTGRYRSLGLVTMSAEACDRLNDELTQLLHESGVGEFKWRNLNGAKERFAALKMCDWTIKVALGGTLRVDVLIWDTQDSRHNIVQRDDIANLQRMYYHVFHNVLRSRWLNDARWRLCPDEHTALDWKTVKDYLNNVSVTFEAERSFFTNGKPHTTPRRNFIVQDIHPVSSCEWSLVQLADFFAGLAVFSYKNFGEYQKWLKNKSLQTSLFDEADASATSSGASRERFAVLKKFNEMCKQKKLRVSLESKRGLRTFGPQNPINFWMYEPQHPEDKAPQKVK